MFNYALILFEGKVTAVDETEAGRYFKMAADKGHAKAMYAYGVMLYKGISVPINETEADTSKWHLIKEALMQWPCMHIC